MLHSLIALLKKVRILQGPINWIRHLRKQGVFAAGHYYSPIPARKDVINYVNAQKPVPEAIPGINLNEAHQFELLNDFLPFYREVPFPKERAAEYRYFYENGWFSYSDAIFLHCFLRKYKPKRIIEVGSGFSSAVILDTIDIAYTLQPEVSFIEPFPDRLKSLFRPGDQEKVELIERKIQDVSPETFLNLESGDLLFIDSSHVVKCGSDLQFLLFEIIPNLKPGVFVHFHDIFYPFEYPAEWLTEGIYWNENYFIRAFLSYNSEWSIQFFNTFAHHRFHEFITNNSRCALKIMAEAFILGERNKIKVM